jgi:two-component system response regulator
MKNKVILLVEDSPRDETLTLRTLSKANVVNEIVVIRDGAEALDYLFATGKYDGRDAEDLPEVLLLDLKLPKVDGLQILERLRANESTMQLPVVVFTSSSEQEDKVRSSVGGANSYVRKPIAFEQFAEATRQLGIHWLLLNQTPPIEY